MLKNDGLNPEFVLGPAEDSLANELQQADRLVHILADLPDLVLESILFEPNPCYRGQKCRVRVKVRNDGSIDAEHFVVRWAPEGEAEVPVEWDMDSLAAGEEKELVYPWIPSRVGKDWQTMALVDLNNEVDEIEEGAGNRLEQFITVLEP